MSSQRKRSPVAGALIKLREKMGETQSSMAQLLDVETATVGRWEIANGPTNIVLVRLLEIAEERSYAELAKVFKDALERMKKAQPRKARDIDQERLRWAALDGHLGDIQQEAERLKAEGHPSGKVIYDLCNDMWVVLEEIQKWSWRNR